VLRQLVEGNHVITVKLGNILNINVDVDELLVESWTTNIQDHQKVFRDSETCLQLVCDATLIRGHASTKIWTPMRMSVPA
jgi:hypothetical protein